MWHWFNALQEECPVWDLQRSLLQCQTQERVLPLHLPALPHPSCWLVLLQKPDGWSWRLLQAVRPRGTFKRPPVQPTGSTRNSPGDNLSTLFYYVRSLAPKHGGTNCRKVSPLLPATLGTNRPSLRFRRRNGCFSGHNLAISGCNRSPDSVEIDSHVHDSRSRFACS